MRTEFSAGGKEMKKLLVLFLVFIFGLSISCRAVTEIETKQAELVKVKEYLKVLDKKIEEARGAKNASKEALLKDEKKKILARADTLSKEIELLTVTGKRSRLQAEAGFGGGAGMMGFGYRFAAFRGINILFNVFYGIGNKYSIVNGNISGIRSFGANFAGLIVGITNYSEKVTDIPGISGNIEKGSRIGAGLLLGRVIGPLRAQLGYNTALGLTAGVAYQF
jgi:hypothetical protein